MFPGASGIATGYPLDTVKVRQQALELIDSWKSRFGEHSRLSVMYHTAQSQMVADGITFPRRDDAECAAAVIDTGYAAREKRKERTRERDRERGSQSNKAAMRKIGSKR